LSRAPSVDETAGCHKLEAVRLRLAIVAALAAALLVARERYFGRYRALVKSPTDIGSAATGLSPDDVLVLRSLYDR